MDWASGQALGPFVTYEVSVFAPYRLRLRLATSMPIGVQAQIVPGQEYFAYQLTLRNLKTVGVDACPGCEPGACVGLKFVCLNRPDNNAVCMGPGAGGVAGAVDDGLATWQGGGGLLRERLHHTTDCPAATPVRNSTWGGVKALYR